MAEGPREAGQRICVGIEDLSDGELICIWDFLRADVPCGERSTFRETLRSIAGTPGSTLKIAPTAIEVGIIGAYMIMARRR